MADNTTTTNPVLEPVCSKDTVFDWQTESWIGRHEAICKAVQEGDPEVIFIGDSITHHFEREGVESWTANYAKYRPVNMGFGGDRIPDHHQAKIDEIREKQREVRAQLKQAKTGKRTFWSEVARGLEEDIDGATRRYHRWLEDIDTET